MSKFFDSVKLLRRLHVEMKEGRGAADSTDEIREEAAELWHQLTIEEREELDELSEALYAAEEKPAATRELPEPVCCVSGCGKKFQVEDPSTYFWCGEHYREREDALHERDLEIIRLQKDFEEVSEALAKTREALRSTQASLLEENCAPGNKGRLQFWKDAYLAAVQGTTSNLTALDIDKYATKVAETSARVADASVLALEAHLNRSRAATAAQTNPRK